MTSIVKDLYKSLLPLLIAAYLITAFINPRYLSWLFPITTLVSLLMLTLAKRLEDILKGFTSPFFQLGFVTCTALVMSCIYSMQPDVSLYEALDASLSLLCFALLWSLPFSGIRGMRKNAQLIIAALYTAILLLFILINAPITQAWIINFIPTNQDIEKQSVILTVLFWPIVLHLTSQLTRRLSLIIYALTATALYLFGTSLSQIIFIIASLMYVIFLFIPLSKTIGTTLVALLVITISAAPLATTLFYDQQSFNQLPSFIITHFTELPEVLSLWHGTALQMNMYLPFGSGINMSETINHSITITEHSGLNHHHQNYILELGLDLGLLGFLLAGLAMTAAIAFFHHIKQPVRPFAAATILSAVILYTFSFSVWQEWRSAFTAFALLLLVKYSKNRYHQRPTTKTRSRFSSRNSL